VKTIDRSFDLNALRVLVALHDTRNVTQGAASLEMSQSGFSTALARLRTQLGDPLFVRTRHGMEPTDRALIIIETARRILEDVQHNVFEPPVFRAESEQVEFRLSMADVAEVVFLPKLVAHLRKVAPGVTLHTESLQPEPLRAAMEAGRVELAVGYFPDLEIGGFFQQRLFTHTYACMLRRNHPVLARTLTRDTYATLGHAVVISPARTNDLFERFLERHRIRRKVAVRTPHHLSLPSIVAESDLVATVPVATAHYFAGLGAVTMAPLPLKPPVFGVQQHWHRRNHKNAKMVWLRQQMTTLFNDGSDIWLKTERDFYGDIRASRR
jgi:DNA-binding transcriptional LysR family regulator